jgi:hypothetical protein
MGLPAASLHDRGAASGEGRGGDPDEEGALVDAGREVVEDGRAEEGRRIGERFGEGGLGRSEEDAVVVVELIVTWRVKMVLMVARAARYLPAHGSRASRSGLLSPLILAVEIRDERAGDARLAQHVL